MKNIHFILTATINGGGVTSWKLLFNNLNCNITLHYSSYSEKTISSFKNNKYIQLCKHDDWPVWEFRNYRLYDHSNKKFNFNEIPDNSIVIFDSIEGIRQLAGTLKKKCCKLIWHMQSPFTFLRKNPLFTLYDIQHISYLDEIIVISHFIERQFKNQFMFKFLKNKLKGCNISHVYHGIKVSKIKSIPAENDYIIFFGRFEKYKNPLFLENINEDVRYIGSADGCSSPVNPPEDKQLGWMPPDEAAKKGDIFIVPSIDEAFGLVVIEMMARGKIVIGFNSGAFPEIIEHGTNGFLIDPFDHKTANEIIKKIRSDQTYKERIKENALKRALFFNDKKYHERFFKVINVY